MFDAWHYINPPEVWTRNETDCYCPVIKKKMNCPPIGLLDANKCTKIPVFISEPHFYNGDPTLLDYVPDLNPNQKLHSSFLLLDSFTSTPLEACRKSQINMKIIQQPIDLLANVTEGYFPILWSNEAAKMDPTNLEMIKMTYQLRRFVLILQWLPAAIGVFLLLLILMCYKLPIPRKKLQSIDTVTTINPNFVSSNIQGLEEHLPRGRNHDIVSTITGILIPNIEKNIAPTKDMNGSNSCTLTAIPTENKNIKQNYSNCILVTNSLCLVIT
ncbi:hypothetical protein M0802_015038 [Mischocyttarus mexicanus]|nr:hypothetical protein M0802_015038 [Mischocyttarus mexicanus]